MRPAYIDKFWRHVDKTEMCWLWTLSTNHGYGQMWTGERIAPAHRIAWELTNGPIAAGLNVCHRCDTPRCVRPTHLFLGTQSDNLRDMRTKGRGAPGYRSCPPRGETNVNATLTAADVIAIRRDYATGAHSLRTLSHRHLVSRQAIASVIHRRTWKHIT